MGEVMVDVMTTAKFSEIIERTVIDKRITYLDAVIWYCEKNELEIDVAAKLLNTTIKSKLEVEAQDLNFLAKGARLPL
jgi:hypothetical protein|tara:strand:- start:467 stop:700 length:234 start_codon:yes stop_codon:yes gene_type:complete